MEFEEQERALRQGELGMKIDRPHLHLVEQLDARDRDAGLDRHDYRVAGGLHARERANAGGDRLGDAVQLRVISVMMPSVPSDPISSRVRS